jgi:hypothetical protein
MEGIRLTLSLPSAKADIMATSNSSLPVFPRLEPLKNSLVPCSRYGETKINGREGGEGYYRNIQGISNPWIWNRKVSYRNKQVKKQTYRKRHPRYILLLPNRRRTLHHEIREPEINAKFAK